ncbi:hypothetical protein WOLCODRAFT_21486 [Wolfiporia cocos MD-104 SS10]|uniref:Uncharacterized protein n=1 Tax=Wolfiporia cocos (strain MD-104) TaxID=742152 RepID=A0A2H3JD11_WOLCO|nr:hypothetical protein WOLCODRAFT_21486 [Wolfiporia cocos MD-104 SS10]
MSLAPNRFMQSVHTEFPDNSDMKIVSLYAQGHSYPGYGDRHVLLQWDNGIDQSGSTVTQIVQLSGQVGSYAFYHPVVKRRSKRAYKENVYYELGAFPRVQRDLIVELATKVEFSATSVVNGCRAWTRDLLQAMVQAGLISQWRFEELEEEIPLVKRRPEA